MKRATEDAARALFRADETIDNRLIDAAFDVLRGKTVADVMRLVRLDPILSRRKAAEAIGRSVKTIDNYCLLGLLKRVKGAGKRSIGIPASSVKSFVAQQMSK